MRACCGKGSPAGGGGARSPRRLRTGGFHVALLLTAVVLVAPGCTGEGEGEPVLITVPQGASFSAVTDSLAAHDVVKAPPLFKLYGQAVGAASEIMPGVYRFRPGTGWKTVLERMRGADVLVSTVVIPEGWDLRRIAPRLAAALELPEDSVMAVMTDSASVRRLDVPGPTLEGYLYPATYGFPRGTSLDRVLDSMVERYRQVWTPERRAAADSIDMSEREVVTLASIIEKEAKLPQEMPFMAAVYHNRLRIGMALGADPTVQYALGEHQARLLYSHIDSVAGNPYNTYRNRGLPPGPIASPSATAIDAVLHPAAEPRLLYFVATPQGAHVFTRSLEEHNRVRAALRRAARDAAAAEPAASDTAAADTAAAEGVGADSAGAQR